MIDSVLIRLRDKVMEDLMIMIMSRVFRASGRKLLVKWWWLEMVLLKWI